MSSRFLSRGAEHYDRYMGRWSRRLAVPFIDFAMVTNPESVLDVGCGTGSLTFALTDRWPQANILGIDPSHAFIAAARAPSLVRANPAGTSSA